MKTNDHPWVIVLAGGDGTRLRSLTQRITGDARPKQFCPLLEGETLLERTLRRADLVARPDHQVVVVTRAHEPYWAGLERDLPPGRLVAQPTSRGTAPGILYPLLRVEELAGDAPVVVFPSDHEVGDDTSFVHYVESAVATASAARDRLVLLGIEPERPETEYGWIETAQAPLGLDGEPVFPVRRFWEKPTPALARTLFDRGCLWNSFVMAGRVSAFRGLMQRAVPGLLAAFGSLEPALGTPREGRAAAEVYAAIAEVNFSEAVLQRAADRLLAMRVKSVGWCDLGTPARVVASILRSGRRPPWLGSAGLASTA
jgi:mannose-1-phosphate guanylyltransferase